MATDIARAFFVGRLTRDIEVLFSGTGNLFGVINLAVHAYQGKDQPEKTNYFRVTVPGRTVDAIGTYLTKGRQIAVDAVPVMSSWTGQDGTKRNRVQFDATNIELLSEPRAGGDRTDEKEEEKNLSGDFESGDASGNVNSTGQDRFEDDMPF